MIAVSLVNNCDNREPHRRGREERKKGRRGKERSSDLWDDILLTLRKPVIYREALIYKPFTLLLFKSVRLCDSKKGDNVANLFPRDSLLNYA